MPFACKKYFLFRDSYSRQLLSGFGYFTIYIRNLNLFISQYFIVQSTTLIKIIDKIRKIEIFNFSAWLKWGLHSPREAPSLPSNRSQTYFALSWQKRSFHTGTKSKKILLISKLFFWAKYSNKTVLLTKCLAKESFFLWYQLYFKISWLFTYV